MNPTAAPTTVRDLMRKQGSGMRRRDGGLTGPLRLVVLLGVLTAALLYAPSAWAVTYTVDNTGDTDSQACTGAASDCSLRSAISLSNSTPSVDDVIDFDATVFNGVAANATISEGSADINITDNVTITGGDCDPSAGAKPCVGLDKSGGTAALFDYVPGVSISGIAITGAGGSGLQVQSGAGSLTLKGSWFGVGLDGTTLDANVNGVTLVNASNAVIGGSTVADRNVFSSNSGVGIAIAGNADGQAIRGNYFGALPSGNPSSSPGGTGIDITGASSGHTIGGDATTAGQCDGQCNLFVGFSDNGIHTLDVGGAPSSFTISGNFIGLGLNGTSNQGNGTGVNKGSGIDLEGASNVTIGGAANTKRNYIAGNTDGGIKATLVSTLNVTNNYIGLNAAGTASIANTYASPTGSGGLTDLAGTGGTIADNRFGGNGVFITGTMTFQGNVIGVGPSGQDLGIASSEPGLTLAGNGNNVGDVGGTDSGDANTIGNVKTASNPAVLLTQGSSNNTIQGNFIGTTSTGTPEPNAGKGIFLGGNNLYGGNTIGGSSGATENVISNSGGDAIAMVPSGGPTQVLRNVGKNNGSGANDVFFDLGGDGLGNPGGGAPNNGISAPAGLSATSTLLSGTGDNGDTVRVYSTYTSHDDIRAFIGTATVSGGTWSVSLPSLPAGQCVTANQTDTSNYSSEMATAVAVGGGTCVLHPTTEIASGPAEGTSTADPTPTFGFSSPDSGVTTFECKIDGDAFSSCAGGFTPSTDLSDGTHTFTVHGMQAPSNPGLGPDVGAPVVRTFTVDTTGPVISFTSGPAEGATIDTSSTSIGFSANEASTFECKLDGGSFVACSSPFAASSLTEGTHTLQIQGTDMVGNVGSVATRTFSVKLPVAAPPTTPPVTPKKKCKKAKKGQASAAKKCKKKKK
jgi:hypothetical protein